MSGCSSTCQPKIPSSTPGAPGKNAYTFLVESFTMPAISATVTVTVSNAGQFGNRWAVVGQVVFVEGAGYFTVTAIVGTNQLTLFNLGYPGNTNSPTTIGSGGYISPAGLIGPQGTAGGNGVNGTARLYEVLTTQSSPTISTPPGFTWAILAGYNIPANTFVNNGDSLLIKANYAQSNTAPISFSNIPLRRVTFQGSQITQNGIFEPISNSINIGLFRTEIEIIRVSSSSILIRNFHDINIAEYQFSTYQNTLSGVDFTIANQLFFSVIQYAANTHTLESLTIDKIVS